MQEYLKYEGERFRDKRKLVAREWQGVVLVGVFLGEIVWVPLKVVIARNGTTLAPKRQEDHVYFDGAGNVLVDRPIILVVRPCPVTRSIEVVCVLVRYGLGGSTQFKRFVVKWP